MTSSRRSILSRSRSDRLLALPLGLMAATAAALLLLVLGFLCIEAWPALRQLGPGLLADGGWHPAEGQFGMGPMLAASLAIGAGALVLAVPVGLASAICIEFMAPPWLRPACRKGQGLLAGIPSVVYGLWGLTELVPLIARYAPPGASLLAAIVVLALMIVPTVGLCSAGALAAVPAATMQGAAALGLSRRAAVAGVAVPAARAGIASGVALALARALGETMAVLMVAGNVVQLPASLFDPVRSLSANIALEMGYAQGLHRAALFVSGLLLIALVMALAWLSAGGGEGRSRAA